MEVGCVPKKSMGLLIIEVFFSEMGVTIYRRHLPIFRCNTDISSILSDFFRLFVQPIIDAQYRVVVDRHLKYQS